MSCEMLGALVGGYSKAGTQGKFLVKKSREGRDKTRRLIV